MTGFLFFSRLRVYPDWEMGQISRGVEGCCRGPTFCLTLWMLLLLAGWICFFSLHSALAMQGPKRWFATRFPYWPSRYYRLGYNIFFLLAIVVLIYFQAVVPSSLVFQRSDLLNWFGGAIAFIGLLLMAAAARNYQVASFLGLSDGHSAALQVNGMNKYVRHPLYAATGLFTIGLFLVFPYYKNLYFLIAFFAYLVIGIKLEEKKLVDVYGNEYLQYQKRVKKMIPKLW